MPSRYSVTHFGVQAVFANSPMPNHGYSSRSGLIAKVFQVLLELFLILVRGYHGM